MLYTIVRPLVAFFLRMYFRRIKFTGLENIHPEFPTLFCGNHTNAFLEAILLASNYPNDQLYYLARADVFKRPFLANLLTKLHIIPIYRIRDGFTSLDRNKETFERVIALLKEGKHVIIFSEGDCVAEKRLRSLKKGSARLAFQAVESGIENLLIQPIGFNYTGFGKSNQDALINISEPFLAKDFMPKNDADRAQALIRFNEQLTEDLNNQMVNYPIPEYAAINEYTEIRRNTEILLAKAGKRNDPDLNDERLWVEEYTSNQKIHTTPMRTTWEKILNFEAALVGILFWLPHFIAHRLTNKIVKSIDFFMSIEVVFRMLFVSIWGFVVTITGTVLLDGKLGVWIVLLGAYFILYRFWDKNKSIF